MPKSILLLLILLHVGYASTSLAEAFCDFNTPGYIVNRFKDQLDGSVLDTYTGLTWRRCNLGESWDSASQKCVSYPERLTWHETLVKIQNFNNNQALLGLAADWRLPNIKELSSLINLSCYYYVIDSSTFPNPQSAYWSSTPVSFQVYSKLSVDQTSYTDSNYIWSISAITGKDSLDISTVNTNAALLVRGTSGATQ